MKLVFARKGHPFIDDRVCFDDLMDYAVALSKGMFLEYLQGKTSLHAGLRVLRFSDERQFAFESQDPNQMKKELMLKIDEFKKKSECDDEDYLDEEDEDDDNDDFYDDEEDEGDDDLDLSDETCFAVIFANLEKNNGNHILRLTAIHRKYRQAIYIERTLQGGKIREIPFEKVDPLLKPILHLFQIMVDEEMMRLYGIF